VNVDTVPRTLLVAAGVAIVCSAMVSVAVSILRPQQAAFELIDRNRAILEAAGMLPAGEVTDRDVAALFLNLDARVADLQSGRFVERGDAHAFDYWKSTGEASGEAGPGAGRYIAVYHDSGADGERYIFPVSGRGMWSTLYGFVALDADLNTITGVVFHRHGETPGIGDRIQNPEWRAAWAEKQIRGRGGDLRFRVVKAASGPHEVDAISGATITSEAAGALVRESFGAGGYGPLIENLAAGRESFGG